MEPMLIPHAPLEFYIYASSLPDKPFLTWQGHNGVSYELPLSLTHPRETEIVVGKMFADGLRAKTLSVKMYIAGTKCPNCQEAHWGLIYVNEALTPMLMNAMGQQIAGG